jgi:hypothetical protein
MTRSPQWPIRLIGPLAACGPVAVRRPLGRSAGGAGPRRSNEALGDQGIGQANRAEGLLTRARALDLLGHHAEAEADRAEAARVAPHHRLLQSEPGAV